MKTVFLSWYYIFLSEYYGLAVRHLTATDCFHPDLMLLIMRKKHIDEILARINY